MLSLSVVILLAAAAFVFAFWWQSDKIKRMTVAYVKRYCRHHGLQ